MVKVKLTECVGAFLDEIDAGESEFARAYRMAVRCVKRNLHWDITGKNGSWCVPIREDGTAEIPDTCLKLTKVGQKTAEGKIAAMTENNSLAKTPTKQNKTNPENNNPSNIYPDYEDIQPRLGVGGYTNIGEYRLSPEENLIYFPINTPYSSVWLEGLSVADDSGNFCVNEMLFDAVVAYLMYKWHWAKRSVPQVTKEGYKRDWLTEKNNAKYRIKKPKIQDMNRASRQSNKFLKF